MLLTTMHVSARRAGQTAAHMIAASLTSRARDSQSEYPINTGRRPTVLQATLASVTAIMMVLHELTG